MLMCHNDLLFLWVIFQSFLNFVFQAENSLFWLAANQKETKASRLNVELFIPAHEV